MTRLSIALAISLGLSAAPAMAGHTESCEHGQPVTMDQLPGPVKSSLQAQAQGKKVEDLRKETANGATYYHAEIVSGGTGTDLKIDENGKVLKQSQHSESKEPENDKD